jgi:hypothetical protein
VTSTSGTSGSGGKSDASPERSADTAAEVLGVSGASRVGGPRRAPFVALVVVILGVGLIGQLILNTSLAQNAFGMHDLQSQSDDLAERQQSLEQQLARLQSPADLAERARALGMVESENPVFLDLTSGDVEGVPVPATAPPPPPTTPPPTTPPPPTTQAPPTGDQSSPGATP